MKYLALLFLSILIISCDSGEEKPSEPIVLTGYIEKGLLPLMDTLLTHYEAKDLNVDLQLEPVNTYDGFNQLLSGGAKMLISSRTYTPREDSLMEVHEVTPFKRIALAHDALVLIAPKDYPLDTINHNQLTQFVSNPSYSLSSDFSQLDQDPQIAVPDVRSSVYAAISRHLFRYEPITIEGRTMVQEGKEDIVDLVSESQNMLGLAFLSQVYMDTSRVKLIPVGYNSDDIIGEDQVKEANKDLGKGQINPKPVHASYVIIREYPYVVTHWIYLQQDTKDYYFYFARYLGEDKFAQRYFTEQGIQGEHIKYKLQVQ